jgi:hypothetical protein
MYDAIVVGARSARALYRPTRARALSRIAALPQNLSGLIFFSLDYLHAVLSTSLL